MEALTSKDVFFGMVRAVAHRQRIAKMAGAAPKQMELIDLDTNAIVSMLGEGHRGEVVRLLYVLIQDGMVRKELVEASSFGIGYVRNGKPSHVTERTYKKNEYYLTEKGAAYVRSLKSN